MGMSQIHEDLVLLLMYLTSWREEVSDEVFVLRAWKEYDFDVLDNFIKKGYIMGSCRAKSICLTDEGVERAKKLREVVLARLGGGGYFKALEESDEG